MYVPCVYVTLQGNPAANVFNVCTTCTHLQQGSTALDIARANNNNAMLEELEQFQRTLNFKLRNAAQSYDQEAGANAITVLLSRGAQVDATDDVRGGSWYVVSLCSHTASDTGWSNRATHCMRSRQRQGHGQPA